MPTQYIVYLTPSTEHPLTAQLDKFLAQFSTPLAETNIAFKYPKHISLTSFFHDPKMIPIIIKIIESRQHRDCRVTSHGLYTEPMIGLAYGEKSALNELLNQLDKLPTIMRKQGLHLSLAYGNHPELTKFLPKIKCYCEREFKATADRYSTKWNISVHSCTPKLTDWKIIYSQTL